MAGRVNLKVRGVDRVLSMLEGRSLHGRKSARMVVGYSKMYAIYVHENLEANHPRGGQAKYLEQPARQMRDELVNIIKRSINAKNGLEEGLDRAGAALLEASQPLVPVDTGALKKSGYHRVV